MMQQLQQIISTVRILRQKFKHYAFIFQACLNTGQLFPQFALDLSHMTEAKNLFRDQIILHFSSTAYMSNACRIGQLHFLSQVSIKFHQMAEEFGAFLCGDRHPTLSPSLMASF